MLKGVILIGGPQKGTRFRPLSFELPKPLFPVAGYPIIYHHIYALSTIEDVKEIYLIGFFQPSEDLNRFILNAQNEFKFLARRQTKHFGRVSNVSSWKAKKSSNVTN